ncbi:Crp/Fnr family transcriptional regulator [Colwellia psychrerythraea]|uniref:Transcriptional regulator, Crp/Fnr family n=1 Tax=Colwellia psychrerythraea TaxID=28229 RepID=A0A099KDJ9_COLPS|nr:helix-turn-helix domain-containing protein [Colwellia psychrerythraea]KGJ87608.1 transcriptional regulator, Crp/Fnr family [Colwellia psychrerythraea]
MTSSNKSTKKNPTQQKPPRYVDCDNCSMQAICQPIGSNNQAIDLTTNYLTRRVEVTNEQSSSQSLTPSTDTTLFAQASPLTAIFAVCSGTFKLCQTNESGNEKIVGFRFPGELMGEDALFLETYNYSAIALGENSVCEVVVDPLSACSQLAPELQQNLIQLLTKQSYEQQRNVQAITGKNSADCLLAAFLLNICQRNAKHSGNELAFELTISRQDIACFLGMRRETLSRLLSKFQHEQLISFDGKQITLLSVNQLKQLANQ